MGIQAAPEDKEVPGNQRGSSVRDTPLWMLASWAVFAVAAGLKCCLITTMFRKNLLGIPSRIEQIRQRLERIWTQKALVHKVPVLPPSPESTWRTLRGTLTDSWDYMLTSSSHSSGWFKAMEAVTTR